MHPVILFVKQKILFLIADNFHGGTHHWWSEKQRKKGIKKGLGMFMDNSFKGGYRSS